MGRPMESSPKRPRISVDVLPEVRSAFAWLRQNAILRCSSTFSRRLKNSFGKISEKRMKG